MAQFTIQGRGLCCGGQEFQQRREQWTKLFGAYFVLKATGAIKSPSMFAMAAAWRTSS